MIPRCQVTVPAPWGFWALGSPAPPARQNNQPRQITAWHNTRPPSSLNRPNSPAAASPIKILAWKLFKDKIPVYHPNLSYSCISLKIPLLAWIAQLCARPICVIWNSPIHLLSDPEMDFDNGSTLLPEAAKHETGFHSDTSGKIYLRSLWKLILANYLRAVHQDLRVVHQDLREGTKREVKHEKKKIPWCILAQGNKKEKKIKSWNQNMSNLNISNAYDINLWFANVRSSSLYIYFKTYTKISIVGLLIIK